MWMRRLVSCAALVVLVGCGSAASSSGATGTQPTGAPVAVATQPTIGAASTAVQETSSVAPTAGQGNRGAVPACAKADTTIALPDGFPASFPLPPGTVITSKEERSGGRLIINTVVPGLDVKGVAEFFEQALPKAGFQVTEGESEPGEAEANYAGNGYQGRWKVNAIEGCAGAVTLQILAGK
jgi:hypothetical protein